MKIHLPTSLEPLSAFNYSSLTDIVLLLLIFFLLTSSFITPEGLRISLPEARHSAAIDKDPIHVVLTRDGQLSVNGRQSARERLDQDLRALVSSPSTQTVLLSCEQGVPIEQAILVLDRVRALGIVKCYLATEKPGR